MRNYRKGNDKTRKSTGARMTQVEFKGSTPNPEKVEVKSEYYNVKAFRDLQNVGVIEVKADPNAEVSKGGYPYAIIAKTNRVVDANYAGRPNIDGNILTRLQNSNESLLLNNFDVVTMNTRLNYLYMNYANSDTGHNNLAVNVEMLKAFNEALSHAYSTMTTQLPYYANEIKTDMPVPSNLTDEQKDIYGKLGGLLHYQTVLQNAVSPIAKYIQLMSLETTAKTMSFRREAPTITALYGLFKKSAFRATLNAVGTNIIGEYFDRNWYHQTNTLINVASRKSNSMTDPLLTATATTAIPTCTMATIIDGTAQTPYYNSNQVLKATGVFLNPDTWQFDGTNSDPATITFEELIYRLNRLMDVSTVLAWARKLNTSPSSVGTITSPSAYYQSVVKLIENANVILTSFVTNMTDVRTFIDKLNSSGMVYWNKGVSLSIDHIETADPVYNVILHNMIANYVGGSATMTYDVNTQRWQASTLWNKYEGIAQFDKMSGGSFLTFGLRTLTLGSLTSTDIAMCLPVMFASELSSGYSKCIAVTRKGLTMAITGEVTSNITADPILARLDPLQVGFSVKIPTMKIDTTIITDANQRKRLASACSQLLLNLIGYGSVYTSTTVFTSACDPDYVCFLDVQIEDVSNEMITFCRNYSPFRVQTPDGKRTIGFGSK